MSIDQKLEELREQWRKEPQNRSKIMMQVKVLKIGKNAPICIDENKLDSFVNNVKEALS